MTKVKVCPRCNEKSYEIFSTHSACTSCNYSPDFLDHRKLKSSDLQIPPWADEHCRTKKGKAQIIEFNKINPELNKGFYEGEIA